MKENESRLGTSESDDPLREMLSGLNRSLIWFVGQTAYRLIKFKDESAEKKDKEGNPTEKMQDLIVQSNLLSGGIEQRFIGSFSAETQATIGDLLKVSGDEKLLGMLRQQVATLEEDNLLTAIVHEGKNPTVDTTIKYLQ
mmetsp:Transcript_44297/g.32302  ORF Transcript_44297/g.32302 Transcript_44297/m.32302 type:complete len:140 (+) Transcript_44297:1681-2100(+)